MSTHVHSSLQSLVARDLVHGYGDRRVLDGLGLVARPGRPLGLVGENGAGKSTLLRLLAGAEVPESGSLAVPADLAHLDQEPSFRAGATVGGALRDALAPLHEAVARLEQLAHRLHEPRAQAEYVAVLEWAQLHDAWDAEHRAQAAAARLGLGDLAHGRPVASLSGGQRMRLALAGMITRRPACVLLDEPTNHLDDEAVAFLEDFLVGLPGVVVVASHDRTFLDNVCAAVVDLDPGYLGVDGDGGNRYSGGYSDYLAVKRASRRRWEEAFVAHREELDALRRSTATTARSVGHERAPRDNDKFVHHKQGQNVARAVSRRVKDAARRIEALERDPVPKPPRALAFRAEVTSASRGGRVDARGLVVPGRVTVPRLEVGEGERLLITGANGSGKSTLLRAIAGDLDVEGHLRVWAHRLGHLPQEVIFARPGRTVNAVYADATGAPVPLVELGLVHPRDLGRKVGELSVGQQRRLGLAIIIARAPDLLLLDEPTNHISLALADELEEALQRSSGTVIVASHDRWLRKRWSGPRMSL